MAETEKFGLLELTAEQLNDYTAGFSDENFLGQTGFGMLYRGKIINGTEARQTKEVIVKIWKNQKSLYIDGIDKVSRLKDEVRFLQQPRMKSHPNLVNLIGYGGKDEPLGVVYDLNARDILHNLLVQGTGTCIDCDVYGYGVILLSLIAKRVADKERPYETSVDLWAREVYKPKKSFFTRKPQGSVVNKTFEDDPDFDKRDGPKITDLAMRCIKWDRRPNVKEVVQCLEALHVVKNHSEALAVKSSS